jgi:hypothetical protein
MPCRSVHDWPSGCTNQFAPLWPIPEAIGKLPWKAESCIFRGSRKHPKPGWMHLFVCICMYLYLYCMYSYVHANTCMYMYVYITQGLLKPTALLILSRTLFRPSTSGCTDMIQTYTYIYTYTRIYVHIHSDTCIYIHCMKSTVFNFFKFIYPPKSADDPPKSGSTLHHTVFVSICKYMYISVCT